MKKIIKQKHKNVDCKFSEAYYQKMVSKRYGVQFSCETDIRKWSVKKSLANLYKICDPLEKVEVVIDDENCATTCIEFDNLCNTSYQNAILILSQGTLNFDPQQLIDSYANRYDAEFREAINLIGECLLGEDKCYDTINRTYSVAKWRYYSYKESKYGGPPFRYVPGLEEEQSALKSFFLEIEDALVLIQDLWKKYFEQK